MSIFWLYLTLVLAGTLIIAAVATRLLRFTVELVEAKHQRRHAERRKAARKGYIAVPIHDEEWQP